MASKRILKKDIRYITWELITECLVYQALHPGVEQGRILDTLQSISDKHNELLALVNKSRGKRAHKEFKEMEGAVLKGLGEMSTLLNNLKA